MSIREEAKELAGDIVKLMLLCIVFGALIATGVAVAVSDDTPTVEQTEMHRLCVSQCVRDNNYEMEVGR